MHEQLASCPHSSSGRKSVLISGWLWWLQTVSHFASDQNVSHVLNRCKQLSWKRFVCKWDIPQLLKEFGIALCHMHRRYHAVNPFRFQIFPWEWTPILLNIWKVDNQSKTLVKNSKFHACVSTKCWTDWKHPCSLHDFVGHFVHVLIACVFFRFLVRWQGRWTKIDSAENYCCKTSAHDISYRINMAAYQRYRNELCIGLLIYMSITSYACLGRNKGCPDTKNSQRFKRVKWRPEQYALKTFSSQNIAVNS